jgi:ketosteroid isomerase-like protein
MALGIRTTMRRSYLPSLALLLLLGVASPARADQLSDDMATLNARWDAAINGADFDALLPMYSSDAELMPPGTRPVTGSVAIRSFFAARGTSVRDHHLQLASVVAFGNYAYTTSRVTATFVKDGSEPATIAGSTVRLLERQDNGTWKIKSHMFLRE